MSSLKATHFLRPKKSPPNADINEITRSVLVDRVERVLSYGGTGKYDRDGTGASACGLAALNFARIVFSMEHGLKNIALIKAVLARECAEVRQLYSIPPSLSRHILISKGNCCYMRIVVWQPSVRCRRYLSRSLVRKDPKAGDNHIRSSWSL
ncbi:hypothetical protein DFH94DRAFT_355629 [Russula ochroleuca]|uniref:Uncharacterized protein n=1 Tax=Russula ochroleuca TaxID=152965 RepID=A0A9P5MKV5_9AGAM|nr:hypothetical protein DFH94DRAFT_355629 [Russula ochroleuca]